MYNLLWKQIVLCICFVAVSTFSFAQKEQWRPEHDDLEYYFGATLGYNIASLSATKSDKFLKDDSVLAAEPITAGGIAIGIAGTMKLSRHWQVKFNPQVVLGAARSFKYTLGSRGANEDAEQAFTLPTTIFAFPLSFKFNSDRIDNFRTYILMGGKLDIDLTSGPSTGSGNADGYIKLKKYQYSAEFGIGFNIFMRWVSISPELKISYGLNNIHDRNPNLKYSSVFDEIKSKMIMFSLHIEH